MKKMRLHIYIVLGIFLVGFILGSFLDLKLTEAIFSRDNTFGITMSAIGTIPGYLILAIIGGGFFSIAFNKKDYKLIYKIVLYAVAVGAVAASIFFTGREFFSQNGFKEHEDLKWLGFLIMAPFAAGASYLGYLLGSKSKTPYLWLVIAIMALAIFLALVPGVTMLKGIFHRPRYRTLSVVKGLDFHAWYERCTNYKGYINLGINKEEFKSFPSGHAGATAVVMLGACFLPIVDKKYEKIALITFYAGFAWCLFISFTRILVGAHFLSDVSMGGLLTSIFMLIANEVIIILNKKLKFYEE